jgi:hypothetical protein
MAYDYSLLRERIKARFNNEEAFAMAVGMARPTLSLKLNGKAKFDQGEISRMIELLGIPQGKIHLYFFTVAS